MQSNRKTREGAEPPDRNAQFELLGASVNDFLGRGLPVISVETKQKALIGRFKNRGREGQRQGKPEQVNRHAFVDQELGKASPYGVYDIARNEGGVRVGITHDPAEFSVETLRGGWRRMGSQVYPLACEMLITADGGGSKGARGRLGKLMLQRLADELGITIHLRHFPPGASKWHKIEHRLFGHLTENWRGRPLTRPMAIVSLISNTRTHQGLALRAELDQGLYETGKKVTDEDMKTLAITRCDFHGEWNYSLAPRSTAPT
jgi:hypothetical protein